MCGKGDQGKATRKCRGFKQESGSSFLLLDLVQSCLCQRLEGMYLGWWWLAEDSLCLYGPDVFLQTLQLLLDEDAALLTHSISSVEVPRAVRMPRGCCALVKSGMRTTALWPEPAPAPAAPASPNPAVSGRRFRQPVFQEAPVWRKKLVHWRPVPTGGPSCP